MSTKHWLAAYGERVPAEIDPDAHGSVIEMLEGAMKRYADKPAFRCFGQTLTMPTPTDCRAASPPIFSASSA